MEGHRPAGIGHHPQIIGAVAHHHGGRRGTSEQPADAPHFRGLSFRIDDCPAHVPGQATILHLQRVGQRVIQSQPALESIREKSETARDQQRFPTRTPGELQKMLGAGGQLQALRVDLFQFGHLESGQQRHPSTQRPGEINFAPHGRLSNFLHLRLHAHQIGNLVDAFDGDEGGIHIHRQQTKLPGEQRAGHHGKIHPFVAGKAARRRRQRHRRSRELGHRGRDHHVRRRTGQLLKTLDRRPGQGRTLNQDRRHAAGTIAGEVADSMQESAAQGIHPATPATGDSPPGPGGRCKCCSASR